MNILRDVLKPVVVVATIVCFLSMGGAMAVAVWLLVPLHWWVSRGSGPIATGGWALLAGLSVAEAMWMYAWVATEHAAAGIVVAVAALVATIATFLSAAARRVVAADVVSGRSTPVPASAR